jgi:hypothetical protein
MIPFIWFITLQSRKTLFCVFLSFRDLTELKWTWAFSRINIFANGAISALEVHEGAHEARTRPGGAVTPLTAPPVLVPSWSIASHPS